jgi:hypothetical protein
MVGREISWQVLQVDLNALVPALDFQVLFADLATHICERSVRDPIIALCRWRVFARWLVLGDTNRLVGDGGEIVHVVSQL